MEKLYLETKIGVIMKTKFFMPDFLWFFYKGNFNASYPFMTLKLYETYLTITMRVTPIMMPKYKTEYKIEYKDIDYFKKSLLIYIRIYHHDPSNSKYIYISGFAGIKSILNKIRNSVEENKLPLIIK